MPAEDYIKINHFWLLLVPFRSKNFSTEGSNLTKIKLTQEYHTYRRFIYTEYLLFFDFSQSPHCRSHCSSCHGSENITEHYYHTVLVLIQIYLQISQSHSTFA